MGFIQRLGGKGIFRHTGHAFTWAALLLIMSACGNRGPLYLPEQDAPAEPEVNSSTGQAVPDPAADESEDKKDADPDTPSGPPTP